MEVHTVKHILKSEVEMLVWQLVFTFLYIYLDETKFGLLVSVLECTYINFLSRKFILKLLEDLLESVKVSQFLMQ
jgi:hypothetical protein